MKVIRSLLQRSKEAVFLRLNHPKPFPYRLVPWLSSTLLALTLVACPVQSPSTPQVSSTGGNPEQESPVVLNPTEPGNQPGDSAEAPISPQALVVQSANLKAFAVTNSSEVFARAQRWVDKGIPYSMSDFFDGYRQDCSGLVSMAWGLGTSAVTSTLRNYAVSIAKDELQTGDAINNQGIGANGHVVLFKAWVNNEKTRFVALEENGGHGTAVQTTLTLVRKGAGWTISEYDAPAPGPYVFQRSNGLGAGSSGGVSAVPVRPSPQQPSAGVNANTNVDFRWGAASGGSKLGLYISKYPYGSSNRVYTNENVSIGSTSLSLPVAAFKAGSESRYRWHMALYLPSGGTMLSGALNFTLETPAPPLESQLTYARVISQFNGLCLDVAGGSREDNAKIIAWPCHTGNNQRFAAKTVGAAVQLIVAHSGKCVDVQNQSSMAGSFLVQNACSSVGSQLWRRDGQRWRNQQSNLCMDLFLPNGHATGDVGIWSCHAGSNQRWAAQAPTPPPVVTATNVDVRLYNVDDFANLYVNGIKRFSKTFGTDTGKVRINSYLVNGQNSLRFVTQNFGSSTPDGAMTYGYQVWVNDQLVLDEQCGLAGSLGCENNRNYPGGKVYDKTININVIGSSNTNQTVPINSVVQGKVYLNGKYTGKTSPTTLTLPSGSYRIGLGGSNNRYQETTVKVSSNQAVNFANANWMAAKPWKLLLLSIRNADLGSGVGGNQTARLTDADIQAAHADLLEVSRRWVEPFSYGLVRWDVAQLTVENVTARITDSGDHINRELFLQDAGLTNLPNQYDAVVFFWPRKPGATDPWGGAGAVGGGWIMSVPNTWVRDLNKFPREVWLHEWLHVVEGVSTQRGFFNGISGLHGANDHGYVSGVEGEWLDWYREFMRGTVTEGDLFIGVPPAAWLTGPRLN
jgi:hypothetical protein